MINLLIEKSKKICLFIMLVVFIISLSACTNKNETKKNIINLDNSKASESKTIFELLNLSDSIEFSNQAKGIDFLYNDQDLVNRFSNNDFYIRYGEYKDVDVNKRHDIYKDKILNWNEEEKNRIIKNIMTFEKYFSDNNINLPSKIYLFKTKDSLEYGKFFIRDNAIFLPESLINGYKENLNEAIVKSLFYMIVNKDEKKYEKLCNSIGFVKSSELIYPKEYVDNKFTNDNDYKIEYYIQGSYSESEFKFMPISYFNEKFDGDKSDIEKSIINKYIAVKIDGGVIKPLYVDDENNEMEGGKLLEINLNQIDKYYSVVSNNSSVSSGPKEILADDFSIMVLGKKKNNENTLNRILSIIKE
ncbi:hypothetical protein [Helicovermis profundi]|uniref:Lipoprotein n=1 Tax=Helicovermis profundi TaxID=3065157 RepID=A0AAU9ENA8_9FIRM|nr:hypothetical protein HLPR_19400 [Clostridia bacterium S502]